MWSMGVRREMCLDDSPSSMDSRSSGIQADLCARLLGDAPSALVP